MNIALVLVLTTATGVALVSGLVNGLIALGVGLVAMAVINGAN